MTEQPKTVVCASCNAKFHVPDDLIRGKLVKFRCRKCGEAIDVDGRRSARPPAAPVPPPVVEVTAVDTPATFSQRTLPPPRPPVALTRSAPNLHPWPEPPRSRNNTAPPTAISDSSPPPPEESAVRADHVRDPSNRAPKIAAIISLLIAAGLSGFGLAMRSPSPSGPGNASATEPIHEDRGASAADPNPASRALAGENKTDELRRVAARTPTRVTDLPPAVDGIPGAGAAAARPSEAVPEKLDTREAVNPAAPPAPTGAAPSAAEATAAAAGGAELMPGTAGAIEPSGAVHSPSTVTAAPAAVAANAPVPPAAPAAQPAAAPAATPAPGPAAAAPLPAARAKGDFNTHAAREAMEDAAGRAGKCRNIDSPSGTARVAVTFAPNGHVTNAVIESGPFVGTAAGSCVASKFRAAKVPPFSGDSVTVRKSVPF